MNLDQASESAGNALVEDAFAVSREVVNDPVSKIGASLAPLTRT